MSRVHLEECFTGCHLQRGRIGEAEAQFERLLGVFHVKSAMAELSRSDKGDDVESIRFSDLLSGHYFRGKYNWDKPIPAFFFLYYADILTIIVRAYTILEVLHCKCLSFFFFFATVVFIGSTLFLSLIHI